MISVSFCADYDVLLAISSCWRYGTLVVKEQHRPSQGVLEGKIKKRKYYSGLLFTIGRLLEEETADVQTRDTSHVT